MKKAILIPVKDLSNAKTRLSTVFTQIERTELALIMLEQVLKLVQKADSKWVKVMVTNYRPAESLANKYGLSVLKEGSQISESKSVDWASDILGKEGIKGCLRLPLDLPLLSEDALFQLMKACDSAEVVLSPSLDGTGTNALFRSPTTLFPSQFGPNSLALHKELAEKSGAKIEISDLPEISLDIDSPEDVKEFLGRNIESPARRFLQSKSGY